MSVSNIFTLGGARDIDVRRLLRTTDVQEMWGCSSLADRRLYVDITRRVEAALLALEAEVRPHKPPLIYGLFF